MRAVIDADGNETGNFEVPAGGRRYRALELLVKQERMSKTQAVPCVVREGGIAEDDSIAENDERVGLHPIDQFRAFQTLRDLGMGEEDIAARHFVSPAIVKQRLRLASVLPKLHDVYADYGMTIEQLMAFSVTADHIRQEQVWENVSRSGYDEPYQICRMLTENTVRGSDRRAQYVGIDAYEQAGGPILRDLFEKDDGGWLQDVTLLDRHRGLADGEGSLRQRQPWWRRKPRRQHRGGGRSSADDIRVIQRVLIERGVLRGEADGVWGPDTREAAAGHRRDRQHRYAHSVG